MTLFACHVSLAEEPAFEVLPSLKRLKDRIAQGGRGKYSAVFMSGRWAKPSVVAVWCRGPGDRGAHVVLASFLVPL